MRLKAKYVDMDAGEYTAVMHDEDCLELHHHTHSVDVKVTEYADYTFGVKVHHEEEE